MVSIHTYNYIKWPAAILLCLCLQFSYGQNLVPNPSFEVYELCPTAPASLPMPPGTTSYLSGWYRPNGGTSDYFNACADIATGMSVPENFIGYQEARTGSAYVGIIPNPDIIYGGTLYREYVQAKLTDTLKAGHEYFAGYWVTLTNEDGSGISGMSVFGIDKLGMLFKERYINDDVTSIVEDPQIQSPEGDVYADTLNWRQVSGTFTATGNESWIILGTFAEPGSLETETVYIPDASLGDICYYFIDDACVIDINGPPTIVAIHDTVICDTIPVSISGRPGVDNYLWNDGSTLDIRLISDYGTYWVRSLDKNNCAITVDTFHLLSGSLTEFSIGNDTLLCTPATLTLVPIPLPATEMLWDNGSTVPERTVTADGVYWVSTRSGCFVSTDSIKIETFQPGYITNADTTLCSGTTILLSGSGDEGNSYQWNPETGLADIFGNTTLLTATETTIYTLLSYREHCSFEDQISIEVIPSPVAFAGNDTAICAYDSLYLNAEVWPDGEYFSYKWQPADRMSDSVSPVTVYKSYLSDIVILTVYNAAGCIDYDTVNIKVGASNFLHVSPQDTGLCPPGILQLQATGAIDYHWSPAYGLDTDTASSPVFSGHSATTYLVWGSSAEGCFDSQYVHIDVYPNAVINLPDSIQLWPGESYQILPESNCLYFNWFPGSGLSNSGISTPIASPQVRTRYFVTAETEHGCIVRDSIDILVNEESILDMPNAFVPGNGANGILKIARRGSVHLDRFDIFNRWGNKVFSTENIEEGWNGTLNGQPQSEGVYIYNIEATLPGGRKVKKAGNITLLR